LKLSEKDAALDNSYNPLKRPAGAEGIVDIGSKGQVRTEVAELGRYDFVSKVHQQVLQLAPREDWTLDSLIGWFDRHIEHSDIPIGESAEFIRKALRALMAKHEITNVGVLALDRFRLRDALERRIAQHRDAEHKAAFKQLLLPGSPLQVSPEVALNFKSTMYEPSWVYEGAFQFKKHYFGQKPGELRQTGEEFECAQFIDELPEVRFWIRNLVRKPFSFRLQTSTDWFYPDFLCQLTDGRVLVVEYKGKDRYTSEDAEEKRAVGAVWAARSNGIGLFAMPTDADFSTITGPIRAGH
jgi:type III restriction enzyme